MAVDTQLDDGTRVFQNNFHRATFTQLPFTAQFSIASSCCKEIMCKELVATHVTANCCVQYAAQFILSPRKGVRRYRFHVGRLH